MKEENPCSISWEVSKIEVRAASCPAIMVLALSDF